MADVNASLQVTMAMEGAVGAALVDWQSGMALGAADGGPNLNLDVAAAGNLAMARYKLTTIERALTV